MKYRASRIGDLMTESRTKGQLSETAKTFVFDTFLQNELGYYDPVSSIPMRKGIQMESEALKLIDQVMNDKQLRVTSTYRERHNLQVRYSNDHIIGTPDIILPDTIEDIKISDNVKTFFKSDLKPIYFWQLMAYMELTGKRNARLIYCLLPDTIEIMEQKIRKLSYIVDNAEEVVIKNNKAIEKIPIKNRIKAFQFEYDKQQIDKLYERIKLANQYYENLKINHL
jgi:hypothetical protein